MVLVVVLIAMMTSLICLLNSLSDTCRGDGGPCGDGPSDGVNHQKKVVVVVDLVIAMIDLAHLVW